MRQYMPLSPVQIEGHTEEKGRVNLNEPFQLLLSNNTLYSMQPF